MVVQEQIQTPEIEIETALTEELNRLEAEVELATKQISEDPEAYAPSYRQSDIHWKAVRELASDQHDPELFSRYLHLSEQSRAVFNTVAMTPRGSSATVGHLAETFPTSMLAREFEREADNGVLHTLIRSALTEEDLSTGRVQIKGAVTMLQQLFETERPLDLLRVTNDPFRNEVRSHLLNKEALEKLHFMEYPPRYDIPQPTREQVLENGRVWMRDVVLRATPITDPELADSYVFATSRWASGRGETSEIVRKMNMLGEERLARIAEFSGIYAVCDYSDDELLRTALLAEGDAAEIARLQEHDVTVVFANRMGDHNRVLSEIPPIIEDGGRRVLLSEIQSVSDIFAYMQKLEARGIKPSTIIFGAHSGDKGEFAIHAKPKIDEQKGFRSFAAIHSRAYTREVNLMSGHENLRVHSMHNMKVVGRMIEHAMQPSRGIDDAPESVGSKNIIFIMCDADTKASGYDIVEQNGQKFSTIRPRNSIAGRLADDMATMRLSSPVRVFAASTTIKAHKTPTGFRYYSTKNGSETPATQITIEGGRVARTQLAEVPLRKPELATR